jgi:putative hydrolase of HD superfamily
MTRLVLVALFIVMSHVSLAQDTSPLAVVQQQLDTYNAQDIDGFAALFAEDAEIFMNIGDTEPALKGRDAIHASYGRIFRENPRNKSTLMGRMVQGNFVFDHEWITGRDSEFRIVAIYEVKSGLIARAWFVR